jgi:hypothetical protein
MDDELADLLDRWQQGADIPFIGEQADALADALEGLGDHDGDMSKIMVVIGIFNDMLAEPQGGLLDRLEPLVMRVRGAMERVAKRLSAQSFSVSVGMSGIRPSISVSLSFPSSDE